MVARELPVVMIKGKEYYMDARLKEYRSKDMLDTIRFGSIGLEGQVELVSPSKEIVDFSHRNILLTCLTKREIDELDVDIIGRQLDILDRVPVCKK